MENPAQFRVEINSREGAQEPGPFGDVGLDCLSCHGAITAPQCLDRAFMLVDGELKPNILGIQSHEGPDLEP